MRAGVTVTRRTARAAAAPAAVRPGCEIAGSTRTLTRCFFTAACEVTGAEGDGEAVVVLLELVLRSGAGDPAPGALVQATTPTARQVAKAGSATRRRGRGEAGITVPLWRGPTNGR
ncbi:hypothetical protein GCM10009843_40230 [Nocardioides bigeumensis]|uniref:Uncharacterized protein n=1 Tax=Nocardioides bigeumensis TaxID=433657 RepID=A0ABN2YYN4_9ACTN